MQNTSETLNDSQKEYCATIVMQAMLQNYSAEKHISPGKALLDFAKSPIYEALFDYSTAIWREGPVYLQSLYEEYQDDKTVAKVAREC